MNFEWTEADQGYRGELTSLLESELPSDWWDNYASEGPSGPELMAFARGFSKKLAERDLIVRHWPVAYGGKAASAWSQIIVSEEMWSNGEPRSSLYLGANWAGPAIMQFGTEDQKRKYLLPIARGELLWCQGFSEPSAGTDLAALSTSAERDGPGYRINGSKVWTSYAARADVCFVLARVSGSGKDGVTCFIVPMDTPGIDVRPISAVHSPHDFNEVFFSDVRVPADSRLGEEGGGWAIVSAIIHDERIGAARYEFSRRALERIIEYLRERELLEDSVIATAAANALAMIEAARLLTYLVIDGRAKGKSPSADTFIARYALIEADHAVANITSTYLPDLLTEVGDGMLRAHFTAAITSGVAAGAAEVQLNMISGRHLGLPRAR